ncbi:glycosyltransferase [Diaminobutyricimonas sp. TR449]|uniref:glycosyltransferase n=1 Tax=Diaminobutyricimonas sp. TR449 TaxID=2708076 RepID=UPI00141D907A|nr:glycosyltransferase [Diaminobutyricimonas sp. TR449]
MPAEIGRIAMVTMHTSPAARPGTGDAGGMNVVVLALARELAGRGIEVDLITRAESIPEPVELGHRVRLVPIEAGPRQPLPKSELAVIGDEFGEGVADVARQRNYDVIHAHYWLSGLATLPVAIELGVPFVQSFHTLAAMKNSRLALDDSPEPEQRMRAEAFIAGEADAVIAGSSAEVHALIDQVNAPADRLWVIPPGVDARLFTPHLAAAAPAVRRWLDIDGGRPIVAVVGRIQPHKGQDLALHVLAELREQFGSAPALVIAGEATPGDDDYLHRLRELAVELEVAHEVRFVGALDRIELAELFAAAAVTLVPSHTETFGLVALESAACGTPAIGSRSTGLADSIADGRSGLLMASRNPAEWARAVASLLDDSDRLATLSREARAHAETYSWEAAAAALVSVYESL